MVMDGVVFDRELKDDMARGRFKKARLAPQFCARAATFVLGAVALARALLFRGEALVFLQLEMVVAKVGEYISRRNRRSPCRNRIGLPHRAGLSATPQPHPGKRRSMQNGTC